MRWPSTRWSSVVMPFSATAERGIDVAYIETVVASGEELADYRDDVPYPGPLVGARVRGRPIHVVLAHNTAEAVYYVVTAYEPDPAVWELDWRTRRPRCGA